MKGCRGPFPLFLNFTINILNVLLTGLSVRVEKPPPYFYCMLIPAVSVIISAHDVDCFYFRGLFIKFTYINIISDDSDRLLFRDKIMCSFMFPLHVFVII